MSRRSRIAVTDAELRKLRQPCPSRSCEGYAAQMVLSRTSWKECTDCGHQWRFRDASSKVITREQRDELVKPRAGGRGAGESEERRVVARRREQYKQEVQEMTKSKKGAKSAGQKKVVKKNDSDGAARKTISSVIRAELKKNPTASNDSILAAFKKAFPDMKGHRARTANDVNWFRRELNIKKPAVKKPAATAKKAKKTPKKS